MNSSPGSEERSSPAPDGSAEAQAMPGVVDHVAVARLYGEPLFALPNDLYIPPDALEVFSKPSKARWTCCCT
jgi:segregation and condensation protein A